MPFLPAIMPRQERVGYRVVVAVLVGLLLLGIVTLVSYWNMLERQVQLLRAAQSDNKTWVVAQLEVDYQNLRLALHEAIETPDIAGARGQKLRAVNRAFDIYYSRIETIAGSNMDFDPVRNADLIAEFDRIRKSRDRLAHAIDAMSTPSVRALSALLAYAERSTPDIRDFVVATLRVLVDRATHQRELHEQLLRRYSGISVFLMINLTALAFLTIVLYRSVRRRAEVLERIGSNQGKAIEASLDAVIVADQDGRIRQFNSSAEAIFGFTRAEALGGNLSDLIVPARFRDSHDAGMATFRATGQGAVTNRGRMLLIACDKSGREFPVEVAIVSDTDLDGRLIFIGFVRDVSAQLEAENELRDARDAAERSARAKSRFLAVMSHEMRTPLNGVIAALDLVDADRLPEDQVQFLDIAKGSGRRALEQVNDVLELTRLDQDNRREPRNAFSPVLIMREIAEQTQPLARERGNRLVFETNANDNLFIIGPSRSFGRAVSNLVSNAAKFTKDGQITIRLDAAPRSDGAANLRVEVSDTGIGISSEMQRTIFDDFETLDSSYARSGGTGLGLGIVRRAVDRMGGAVGVESELGKGSHFWFEVVLPLTAAAAVLNPPDAKDGGEAPPESLAPVSREAALRGPRCTSDGTLDGTSDGGGTDGSPDGPRDRATPADCSILVAEDNQVNRMLMAEMLGRLGYAADLAEDGAGAVEHAMRRGYDVILMDISMPGMDGVEATRRIRAGGASARAHILGVTAHTNPEEVPAFIAAGMDDVLPKPVTLMALRDRLCRLVAGAPQGAAPRPAPDPPEAPLFSADGLEALREVMSAEQIADMMDLFQSDTEAALDAAEAAFAAGEMLKGAAAVHKAAGAAAVLGAARLKKVLVDIERAARREDRDSVARLMPQGSEVFRETMRAAIRAMA